MRPREQSLVLRVVPRDRETDVPRDATVLVTAPRPVDHHTTHGVRVSSDEGEVDGALGMSSDRRILFWRPAQALEARARHQVTIRGMRDERGAHFLDHASTFVTGAYSYVDLQFLSE